MLSFIVERKFICHTQNYKLFEFDFAQIFSNIFVAWEAGTGNGILNIKARLC